MKQPIRSYQLTNSTVRFAQIDKTEWGTSYLSITLDHEGGATQGYPAFNLKNLDEGIQYFNSTFGTSDLEEIKGKTVICLSSNSEIFAIINPNGLAIFSLQAKYCSNQYIDEVDRLRNQPEGEFLSRLSDCDAIIWIALDRAQSKSNPELKDLFDKYQNSMKLATTLDCTLTENGNKSGNHLKI